MQTGQHHRLETLFAGMNSAFAELVILVLAVFTQEERPFQMPFLAPAHMSPSSVSFYSRAGIRAQWSDTYSSFTSAATSERSIRVQQMWNRKTFPRTPHSGNGRAGLEYPHTAT